MDNYVYPIRVYDCPEENRRYRFEFIDLTDGRDNSPIAGAAQTPSGVIEAAQSMMAIHIKSYIDMGIENELPQPTLGLGDDDVIYIHIWLPYYCHEINDTYVKKTLTIPQWLNTMAMEKNINFSAALANGVRESLKEKR